MECPNCKLINPPGAVRCDCGYDFSTGTMKKSLLSDRERKIQAGTAAAGLVGLGLVVRAFGGAVVKPLIQHGGTVGLLTAIAAGILIATVLNRGRRVRSQKP